MVRSAAIITFTVSLLLWSAQAYSDSSQEFLVPEVALEIESAFPAQGQPCCVEHQHSPGRPCPIVGHRHPIGQSCPSMVPAQGVVYRLGSGNGGGHMPCPLRPAPDQVGGRQPMPAGPPPNGLWGGAFMPRQYPYQQAQAQGYSNTQGYGYGDPNPVPERIVYIPYAAPPPIHVERLGKALPVPRPPMVRRILGDAYMYEYPEMPLRTYTTRGPRDFLAPNPPSIGE